MMPIGALKFMVVLFIIPQKIAVQKVSKEYYFHRNFML
jgi:hypothetical protein